MLMGYARVSTAEQTTALQLDALHGAGVEKIWEDVVSGAVPPAERPQFARLLDATRPGDEVVVWSLDRLGRSAAATLAIIELLDERGVTLRVLREGLATTGTTGRLMVAILAAVAEMERSYTMERSAAGQAAARARGVHMGRPPALTPEQRRHAAELRAAGQSLAQVGRLLGVSRTTVLRATRDELVRHDDTGVVFAPWSS